MQVFHSLEQDEHYLAGFREAITFEDLRHTSGNVGHIESVPLNEIERKQREEKRNFEVQLRM
jgi:hypothetical protein